MKAMITAAGKGRRLAPLTDKTPKPLVDVGGRPLITHIIERLKVGGFTEIVINVSYLAEHIMSALGDGGQFGVQIQYSQEPGEPLETGGGIMKALPLLGAAPFLVVHGDAWTDYPFERLQNFSTDLAHLVLVDNQPSLGFAGDFDLNGDRVMPGDQYTFSGVRVFSPKFFDGCQLERFSLGPMLKRYVEEGRVTGEFYSGQWFDIGSVARLNALNAYLGAA